MCGEERAVAGCIRDWPLRLERRGQLIYNRVGNKRLKLWRGLQREVTNSTKIVIITDTTGLLIANHHSFTSLLFILGYADCS